MFFNNLRTKLWLTIVSILVIFILMLGILLTSFFENFYFEQTAKNLIYNGNQLAELALNEPDEAKFREEVELLSAFLQTRIMISDPEGLVQVRGGMGKMHNGMRLSQSEVAEVMKGNVVVSRGMHQMFDNMMLKVAVPIKQQGNVLGGVLLYAPVETITEPLQAVRKMTYYVAFGAVLAATVLSFFLAQWLTRPVIRMNRVALAMARGNFKEKITVRSKDELGVLGQSLNYLSKELEQNLHLLSQEKNQLGNILTSMTDGVVTFNTQGNILLVNPQAKALLQGIKDLEPGQNLDQCCPFPEIKAVFQKVVNDGSVRKEELNIGDSILSVSMAPLEQEKGDIRGVVAVFQDVTKERKLEDLRREFVANVSHELRTPLTYLQGYTEALLDGIAESEEEKKKYLNTILDESHRLKRLVNDLLDLSQLQTGNMPLKKEEVNLNNLVKRVVSKFEPAAKLRKIDLKMIDESGIMLVEGDEDRLEQVLINLSDNALRYTPEGEEILIKLVQSKDFVKVSIQDKGPGISEKDQFLVWDRFYKVDKARTRDQGGTGLGLAIVKNIIDSHQGEAGVESKEGQGTLFWFKLPVKEQ